MKLLSELCYDYTTPSETVKLLRFYRLLINPMVDFVAGELGAFSITLIFWVMKFGDKCTVSVCHNQTILISLDWAKLQLIDIRVIGNSTA